MAHHWYVLRSKPCKEEFLAGQMEAHRIEIFNPRIRVQSVDPRARKIKPYFPGYMFAHMDVEKTGTFSTQYIPGAAGVVTSEGRRPMCRMGGSMRFEVVWRRSMMQMASCSML